MTQNNRIEVYRKALLSAQTERDELFRGLTELDSEIATLKSLIGDSKSGTPTQSGNQSQVRPMIERAIVSAYSPDDQKRFKLVEQILDEAGRFMGYTELAKEHENRGLALPKAGVQILRNVVLRKAKKGKIFDISSEQGKIGLLKWGGKAPEEAKSDPDQLKFKIEEEVKRKMMA